MFLLIKFKLGFKVLPTMERFVMDLFLLLLIATGKVCGGKARREKHSCLGDGRTKLRTSEKQYYLFGYTIYC